MVSELHICRSLTSPSRFQYDLSASQFSPDGRVFQIDYASKAVEKSGTVIGIRGKDAVVLAVEKIITSKLYEPDAGGRIFTIEKNIGMAVAGLVADGNFVADIARQEAANYRQQFEQAIPLKHLCHRVAGYVHAYTLYSAVRPFGLSIILASWDEVEGPQLYKIEPSGSSFGYFACASGKAKQLAKTEMEKLKTDMRTDELVESAGEMYVYSKKKGLIQKSGGLYPSSEWKLTCSDNRKHFWDIYCTSNLGFYS